jgi:hypothetical protein
VTDKANATKAGVADSWDHWLEQHPVSVGELIEGAVKAAVNEWLNRHGEAVFASAIDAAVKRATVVELAAASAEVCAGCGNKPATEHYCADCGRHG